MLAARSPRGSIVGARQPTSRQQRERSTPQCFLARFSEGTEPNHRGSLTTGAAELLASRAISSAIAGAKSENGGKRTKRTKNGFLRIGQNRKNLVTFGKDRKKDEKTMRELPLSPPAPSLNPQILCNAADLSLKPRSSIRRPSNLLRTPHATLDSRSDSVEALIRRVEPLPAHWPSHRSIFSSSAIPAACHLLRCSERHV